MSVCSGKYKIPSGAKEAKHGIRAFLNMNEKHENRDLELGAFWSLAGAQRLKNTVERKEQENVITW